MAEEAGGTFEGIVTAKVIRADGTEEDLGVISVTSADAERIISDLKALKPDEDEGVLTLEQVNEMTAQQSAENDEASQRNREADTDAAAAEQEA